VIVVVYHSCYSFFSMGPVFSDGVLKTEDSFYSRCDNTSSEVANEIFRMNGIRCQFFLGKNKEK